MRRLNGSRESSPRTERTMSVYLVPSVTSQGPDVVRCVHRQDALGVERSNGGRRDPPSRLDALREEHPEVGPVDQGPGPELRLQHGQGRVVLALPEVEFDVVEH
jgi:hypothetical protein